MGTVAGVERLARDERWTAVAGDPWVLGCAAAGAVILAASTISMAPWPLWLGWAYLALISVVDARPST